MITARGQTTSGRRKNNEDSFGVFEQMGLFVVADGLGGYAGGEIASRLVVETLRRFFKPIPPSSQQCPRNDPGASAQTDRERMELAIRMCQREVVRYANGPLSEMGSTVALVWFRHGRVTIAHVGDSRVYRLRNRKLQRMTRDHSVMEQAWVGGKVGIARKLYGPTYASMVTRSLGRLSDATPTIRMEQVQAGDIYLVCSDGLTCAIPDKHLEDILNGVPIEETTNVLLYEAFARGSSDNITALVVEVS